jgi:hypothetical protein
VLISANDSALAEVVTYSSKSGGVTLNLDSNTVNNHNNADSILLVDDLGVAEEGQNYFHSSNFPVRRNTIRVYDDSTGAFTLRTEGTDYFFNRTNGELQYSGAGLPVGTRVLLSYTYYTGLFALVQKVVTGDPTDAINFPGISAGGVIIYVDTPSIRTISVIISISVVSGTDESEARDDVQLVIENYIDSRTIGQDVILAQIIDRAMSVDGVNNAQIQSPTSDLVILEDELPKSFDSGGNSLVTVL